MRKPRVRLIADVRVVRGLYPPEGRAMRRENWAGLIEVAKKMKVGEAAVISNVEVTNFRAILATLGYRCVTDGWRSTPDLTMTADPRAVLAFKLSLTQPEEPIDFQI